MRLFKPDFRYQLMSDLITSNILVSHSGRTLDHLFYLSLVIGRRLFKKV